MTYAILPDTEKLVLEVEIWLDAEEAIYNAANAAWIASSYKGPGPERGVRCNWNCMVIRHKGVETFLMHSEALI